MFWRSFFHLADCCRIPILVLLRRKYFLFWYVFKTHLFVSIQNGGVKLKVLYVEKQKFCEKSQFYQELRRNKKEGFLPGELQFCVNLFYMSVLKYFVLVSSVRTLSGKQTKQIFRRKINSGPSRKINNFKFVSSRKIYYCLLTDFFSSY